MKRLTLFAVIAALVALFTSAAGPANAGGDLRHGKVTVDGGNIHYVRAGNGPPLVLLHGWLGTWYTWNKVIPELARDHTVIAIDLPGLGDSSVYADGYDKATTARRVRDAVRKIGFRGQVELLAHDVGGQVAYPYARDFPAEVSRLMVIESVLPGFGQEDFYAWSWHFLFNMSPLAEQVIDRDDVKPVLDYFYDGARHPENIARQEYYKAYGEPGDRHAGYEYYRSLAADSADNQANAEAKKLRVPVLAAGGQYALGGMIAASFGHVADDVREVIVPDAGHFVPEETPRFTIDCAKLFFANSPQPAPPASLAGCAA
ncbi:epoxide hydrolase [Acrocarpospora phusangensis]|uniref:Epoxide hydrolase n=1 Tax=Acrocarpospora phusangensis TaxID=1070424 RepID=A0A919Q4D3_9ACTN|nr:alpha/beta hydrolase [Acrocarpospora phusangensis]GIH21911.1 epoxide hydrolase [Acrocarpospora phusangensis]